jgi:uncharacterized protein
MASPRQEPVGLAKRFKRMIWHVVTIIVAVYVLFSAMLFFLQGSLVYRPTREILATPAEYANPMDFEDVYLQTSDGVKINGWFIPAPSPKGTVLLLHGNGGNISYRLDTLAIFHDLGYNAMIIDYRGYGLSEGSPGEQGTYLDAEAAWSYLTQQRKIDPKQIVIFGRSLGGAVASWLAVEKESAGLILESSFTSVPDRAAEMYWYMPIRMLARIDYNTLGRLDKLRCPLLVIHSQDDEIIPYHHGRELFEAAGEPKRFQEITGGHNNGFLISGDTYTNCLAEFLDSSIK